MLVKKIKNESVFRRNLGTHMKVNCMPTTFAITKFATPSRFVSHASTTLLSYAASQTNREEAARANDEEPKMQCA